MRCLAAGVRAAFVAHSPGSSRMHTVVLPMAPSFTNTAFSGIQQRHLPSRLSMSSSDGEATLQHIGRDEMEEIIDDYENGGREESGYVVIDVREMGEIEYTGKLSENTQTMPLQTIMGLNNAFTLDEPDFENVFGFEKPTPDETLVFSCAAGIRSVHAANFAKAAGYSKLVNYVGGANEWFSPN